MDIIVIGTRLKINKDSGGGGWLGYLEQGFDGEPNPTLSPETGGSGGPYEEMPAAKETPCVSSSPDDYSLAEINNVALVASNEIAALNDERYEYWCLHLRARWPNSLYSPVYAKYGIGY